MPLRNLLSLAFRDFFARKARLFLSLLGIICGVACLLFLLSLVESVKRTVKHELIGTIPVTEMKVKPKEKQFLFSIIIDNAGFNDDLIEYIKNEVPGVDKIYPVQSLDVPTIIAGKLRLAKIPVVPFQTDVAVFGIPREVIKDCLKNPDEYVFDPDAEEVPIIISRDMVDLYNIGFGKTLKFGRFHHSLLLGQKFTLSFIKYIKEGKKTKVGVVTYVPAKTCRIVGISKRAPIMGITVPLEYIQYWRKQYWVDQPEKLGGDKNIYEYMILNAKSTDYVGPIQRALEAKGLEVITKKEILEKINSVSFIMYLVFGTFGILMLFVSSVTIFNVLSMSVNEEKVDIGILRSVGARKLHIRLIYLLKAGFIGLMGAIDGILIGFIVIRIGDKLLLSYIKQSPYTPESFFAPTSQIVLGCFLVGVLSSLFAGLIPANHAARLKPAVVLRQG